MPAIISKPTENFYKKEDKKELSKRIQLSNDDMNPYYRAMIRVSMVYNESLYYFARADFHQNKTSQRFNRISVLKKLICIYKIHKDKELLLKTIGIDEIFIKKLRNEGFENKKLVNVLGSEKAAFSIYYPEYISLQKELDKIYDKYHLDDILQRLNERLMLECSRKNLGDRADYYLTFDDMQIFNYCVAPIIGFHAILISFVFLPAGATITGTVIATATGTGLGIAKNQTINLIKRIYNIALRNTKYYKISDNALNDRNHQLHETIVDEDLLLQPHEFLKMKEFITELRQISTRNGDFNYFLSNSFKYYAKLKTEINILSNDYLVNRKLFKDNNADKEYNSVLFDKKYLFYKTMTYYRSKNVIGETLKIQVDSIKLITKKSFIMLRGSKEFKTFLQKYRTKYKDEEINDKISKIISNMGVDKALVQNYQSIVLASLNNSVLDQNLQSIELNRKTSFSEDVVNFSDNLGGTAQFVGQVLNIISNIPGPDAYVAKVMKHSNEFDLGLWTTLNAIDGILYLANTSSAIQKYQKISEYLRKISAAMVVGSYSLGIVNLIGNTWAHLFSSPFINSFSTNPFSIFTTLLNVKISEKVSGNYSGIWNDICNNFAEYKSNYKQVPSAAAYDYFVCQRKMDPGEAVHKISDIFKNKLNLIINTAENINAESFSLIEKISNYNEDKSTAKVHSRIYAGINAFYAKTGISKNPDDKVFEEDEILKKYIKILFSIFSQAKELESYDYFLEFIKDLDIEINDFLKLHFVLLGIEDKSVFSVLHFASNSEIYRSIFQDL